MTDRSFLTKLTSLWLARNAISRFLVVGALNTGFSYSIYAALVFVGLDYRLANLGSLLLGIGFSFKTQGSLVFMNDDKRLFLRFVLAWVLIYFVNTAIIAALMRQGLSAYWGGLIALAPTAVMSYVVQKWWVFGAQPLKRNKSLEDGVSK